MTKKFDIHEWQAKQWLKNRLNEQDKFTPDLEDDELKRSKVQQMMAKEKDLANSDYLSDVEPKIEGSQRAALEELANMYSLSEILDTLEDFYAKNDELAAADYAGEFAKEFRKWMDRTDGGEEGGEEAYIVVGEKEGGEPLQYGPLYRTKEEAQKAADERNQNPEYEGISFSVQQELDEQNVTGGGASFNAGVGMGHFGNTSNKKKDKKILKP